MSELSDKLRKAMKPQRKRKWRLRPEILLCDNIPLPLHGLAPRVVMGAQWWDRVRRAAYASTNYHCVACGVHKQFAKARQWLEGHEVYDIDYGKGRMKYLETVPLCHYCHNYIHDGRLNWLLERGEIHHAKFVAIIQYGDGVLASAGLVRLSHDERDEQVRQLMLNNKVAEWGKWRLVVGRKSYPPLFPSEKAWQEANPN